MRKEPTRFGTRSLKLVVLLLVAVPAPAAHAGDKRVSVATILPAVPLGAQQLADIAAKGVALQLPPALPAPIAPTRPPGIGEPPIGPEHGTALEAPAKPRRLPVISEALGPIPRAEWLRAALGKRPDVAVIGRRLVPIVAGGAPR